MIGKIFSCLLFLGSFILIYIMVFSKRKVNI